MASPMQSPRRSARIALRMKLQGLILNVTTTAVSLEADSLSGLIRNPADTTRAMSFVAPDHNGILTTITSYAVAYSITFIANILAGLTAVLAYISGHSIAGDSAIASEVNPTEWTAGLSLAWEDFEDAYTGPDQVNSSLIDNVLFGTNFDANTECNTISCSDKAQDVSSITHTSDDTLLQTRRIFTEEEVDMDEMFGSLHEDVEMEDALALSTDQDLSRD